AAFAWPSPNSVKPLSRSFTGTATRTSFTAPIAHAVFSASDVAFANTASGRQLSALLPPQGAVEPEPPSKGSIGIGPAFRCGSSLCESAPGSLTSAVERQPARARHSVERKRRFGFMARRVQQLRGQTARVWFQGPA